MNCSRCQTENVAAARFCRACGGPLGTTLLQGRTLLAAPPANPTAPPLDVKTILQRAEQTFGKTQGGVTRWLPPGAQNQRELTVFTVDVSGSMGNSYDDKTTKLEAAIRANTIMAVNKARMDPLDEGALATFNGAAREVVPLQPLGTHKRALIEALQGLTAGGGTDINAGLVTAREMFDWNRPDVVRRIVLLTDGQGGHPIRTSAELKQRGVVIDVVGIGETAAEVNEELLRKVASVVNGQVSYRFIKDHQTLVQHYTQLAQKTMLGT